MNLRSTMILLLLICGNTAWAQKTDTATTADKAIADMKMLETKPSFPGGMQQMYKYLSKTLTYPKSLAKEGIGGKVYVNFTVEKNGQITEVVVTQSAHPLIDKEVVSAIKKMPRWVPGTQNGKPVRVKYTIPVAMSPGKP